MKPRFVWRQSGYFWHLHWMDYRALRSILVGPYPTLDEAWEAKFPSLATKIDSAEQTMRQTFRAAMGSPTEQHERLEALIDALDPRHAKGHRASAPWWRTAR